MLNLDFNLEQTKIFFNCKNIKNLYVCIELMTLIELKSISTSMRLLKETDNFSGIVCGVLRSWKFKVAENLRTWKNGNRTRHSFSSYQFKALNNMLSPPYNLWFYWQRVAPPFSWNIYQTVIVFIYRKLDAKISWLYFSFHIGRI